MRGDLLHRQGNHRFLGTVLPYTTQDPICNLGRANFMFLALQMLRRFFSLASSLKMFLAVVRMSLTFL